MYELPVIDMFYSLQGEGRNTGMAAFFVRLAGCNVGCRWCDEKIAWSKNSAKLMNINEIVYNVLQTKAVNCIITGGEPTLYDLTLLTQELKKSNIKTFLETSGVGQIKGFFDWITVSPKKNVQTLKSVLQKANEIKVVIEDEEDFLFAESQRKHTNIECKYYFQPEYSKIKTILPSILAYIKNNPVWRLSLQTHKIIDIK